MRYLFVLSLVAITSAQAQMPYGYGPTNAGPGQVVGLEPGGNYGAPAPAAQNYGQSYGGFGGNPRGTAQPSLGAVSGLSGSGANDSMLSYGLLEGFYKYTTFKEDGIDGAHGVGVSLSAELFRPFFVKGGFDWGTGNGTVKNTTYDFNSVSIGGGAYFAVTDKFHLFAEVGGMYTNLNANKSSLSFSDGAVYLTPGLRFAATEAFELDLSLTATSADSYDSRSVDISGYYKLFSSMDVGVGTGFGNETRSFFAGVRFRW